MTGITGFLGSYIASEILRNNKYAQIIALVRDKNKKKPLERIIESIRPILGSNDTIKSLNRIKPVNGDIRKINFGLSSEEFLTIAFQTNYVFHCAAVVQFDLPIETARYSNVWGTKNLIEFVKLSNKKGNLKRFIHFSTAYVAGNRLGIIYEDDCCKGQKFLNTYEQSKFESEQIVYKLKEEIPITILRPSIIVGDSKTGYIQKANTIYFAITLLSPIKN